MKPVFPTSVRGVIVTVLGAIATALVMGGWNAKEGVAAHRYDVDSLKSVQRVHDVRDSARYQTILDKLCEIKPHGRGC